MYSASLDVVRNALALLVFISLCTLIYFSLLYSKLNVSTGAPYSTRGNIAPLYMVLSASCFSSMIILPIWINCGLVLCTFQLRNLHVLLLLLRWRYSPGWALASFTIRLQASRSLALSFHSFIPIFLRSVDTSSNHLIFWSSSSSCCIQLSYNFFFGIAVFCILSM